MLKPSRLSLLLSFLICGAAFWLMRQDAVVAAEAAERGALFISHVNVFDPGTQATQLDRQVLVIDGVIKSVEAASESLPKLPPGTAVIDGKNKTLLPGLIDVAAFASLDGALPEDRRPAEYRQVLRTQLQAGVTSLLDLNSSRAQMRDSSVTASPLDYPRLRHGAAILTSPGGWRPGTAGDGASPVIEISSLEELELAFKGNREDGCTMIMASVEHSGRDEAALSPEILTRLGQLCASANLPLLVHVEQLSKVPAALLASPKILIGPWASEKIQPALIQALLKARCAFAPALQGLAGFQPPDKILSLLQGLSEPGWLAPTLVDSLSNTKALLRQARRFTVAKATRELAEENAAELFRAGVPLLLGTLSGMPGLPHGTALRAEMQRMQDCGLSPAQVLSAATLNPAKALGMRQLGRVAAGFSADLLLVEGDPGKDLGALRHISAVIRGGKYGSSRELAKP